MLEKSSSEAFYRAEMFSTETDSIFKYKNNTKYVQLWGKNPQFYQ